MKEFPKIGAFNLDNGLHLRRLGNGGWVVSQRADPREVPNEIGAYSTAEEMLEALKDALTQPMG